LFSSDGEVEMGYEKGLIVLAGIFGGMLVLWGAILIGFTCRGKATGCASGRAFELYKVREQELEQELELDQPSGSTDLDLDEDLSSSAGSVHGGNKQGNAEEEGVHPEGDDSSVTSILHSDEDSMYAPSLSEYSADASMAPQPNPRERRTRIAFIIFSLATLVCVPLALVLAFVPLRDTAESSDDYVADARGVVNEVRAAYTTITSVTESSIEILERTPLDFSTICPQVAKADAPAVLRVDLDAIVQLLMDDYTAVEQAVSTNLLDIDRMLTQFEDALHYVEITFDEVKTYVWAVPGILLGLSALTLITLLAVVMAWKRESSLRFQRLLSYGVLPFFIAFSVTCWVVTIAAAVSAAISSDACSPGSSSGSPDDTVRGILQAEGVNANSIVFEFVTAYSRGCKGDDPTAIFDDLKSELQTVVEYLWRNLTAVDSVGVSEITEMCGGDQLDGFLTSARDLARHLTTIRKAMESADLALDCDRMNPVYVDALHGSMCTDVASASAWGFVLFFAIGLSTMSMITLRASWRHQIGEDKIYDESDVADNMILDEHEEYLAYISKYKHEWQEYKGIEARNRSPIGLNASTSGSENSTGTRSDDGSGGEEPPLDNENREEPFDPYGCSDNDNLSSASTEDISFLSLRDTQREGDFSGDGELIIALPPPLLPLSQRIFIDSDDYEPESPGQSPLLSNTGSSDIVYATAVRIESGTPDNFNFDEQEYDDSIEVISPAKFPESPALPRSQSASGSSRARPPPSPNRSSSKSRLSIDTREDSDIIGSLGTTVALANPPTSQSGFLTQPLPNRVQFFLGDDGDDNGPATNVQRQVDHFTTQTRVTLPVTPPRLHPLKMKEMAAKFDSPPPAYRGGNNHGGAGRDADADAGW
jgi:hypothetical protein